MLKASFLIFLSSLAVTMLLAVSVQAEELPKPEGITFVCDFSGRIELTEDVDIVCLEENATVAPGTVIVTNGYELNIELVGNVDFQDLKIVSFEESSAPGPDEAALVSIRARSVTGHLTVLNHGRTPTARGGSILTDYLTLSCGYSETIDTTGVLQRWLNNTDYMAQLPLDRCSPI